MSKIVRKIQRAVIPALSVTGLLSLILPLAGSGVQRQSILVATFAALTITLMVFGRPAGGSSKPPPAE